MSTFYKLGVYGELTTETAEGLRLVEKWYHAYDNDLFITSVREGTHGIGSLHPSGRAFDIRWPKIDHMDRAEVIQRLGNKLGTDFDVVPEGNHIHIELDKD